jgi:membrane associated rhomboid family serine protease
MKTYLKSNLPKISIFLITIFFISNILTLTVPKLSEIVLLYPSNLHEPLSWYRLITYPLYVGGLLAWIHNSLIIVLTGFIIENKLKTKNLISLILFSSIIGGLIFIIVNQGDTYNTPIASPTMISWGYWSATIIIGLRFWRTLNLFEKIVMILCFLSVLSIIGMWHRDFGFFIGQLSVIITIAILTILKFLKHKTGHNMV